MNQQLALASMTNIRQSGVALVAAMLLAALVVSIAMTMMYEQQLFINRLENHFSASQARWISNASIHWSRAILAEDVKGGPVDHLHENWAIKLPDTPFEGATIRGFISDQQQYCNLNNLQQSSVANSWDLDFLQRLLYSLEGNSDAMDALRDWIDSDDVAYPNGAESMHYLTQAVPYRAGNQALTEIGNLSRVKGFTTESIGRLRRYCSVLPEPTPVNVNTASPELLELMLPELSQIELQTIVAARNLHPFGNISEVGKLLESNKRSLSESYFSIGSHYFLVTSQTQFGKSTIRVEALLKREGGGWPQLLWTRYR